MTRLTGDCAEPAVRLVAYLNCDEQYLPGTLARVIDFFQRHPAIDMVFGDVVIVDAEGQYLRHRKMQTPLLYHTWTCHLSTLSCATFFRRRLVNDEESLFRPTLRDVGDGEWMVRMLRRRVKMAALGGFTSVFSYTGANMSAGPNARRENRELFETAPFLARKLRPSDCFTAPITEIDRRNVFSGAVRLRDIHAKESRTQAKIPRQPANGSNRSRLNPAC